MEADAMCLPSEKALKLPAGDAGVPGVPPHAGAGWSQNIEIGM